MVNGECNLFGTRVPPPDVVSRSISYSSGFNQESHSVVYVIFSNGFNEIDFLFNTVVIVGVWIFVINVTDQEIVSGLTFFVLDNSTRTDDVSENNFSVFINMVTFVI